MIAAGSPVRFVAEFDIVVHASCERVREAVAAREADDAEVALAAPTVLPHGLTEGTIDTYSRVWSGYLRFARRIGYYRDIPGRHVPWVPEVLWSYMQFRAKKCKPGTVKSSLSALAHFSHRNKFMLPTRVLDGKPWFHRVIANCKRQVVLDFRAQHGDSAEFAVDQCCPLGNIIICLIVTALGVFSAKDYMRLSRYSKHHLLCCFLQHTCGMRFGHFAARMYTIYMFVWSAADKAFGLMTDWHRYSGRYRYFLRFPMFPRLQCLRYVVYPEPGKPVVLTAAKVMRWHFQWMKAVGETVVFCPRGSGVSPSRDERQRWLRMILLAALPRSDTVARSLVEKVTPHSWRPGLAGDMLAEGSTDAERMRRCRWLSKRVADMYAERPSLGRQRQSSSVQRLREQAPGVYVPRGRLVLLRMNREGAGTSGAQ